MTERRLRTVVKSLSWRIIATITAIGLVYAFTGSFTMALSLGIIEVVGKLIIYYIHDRAWQHLRWGMDE